MPLSNRVCFCVNLRDGLSCQQCGRQPGHKDTYHRGFEYHHRRPRSQGGTDEIDNVLLLCHQCHQQLHHHQDSTVLSVRPMPLRFPCGQCQHALDPATVVMNCGWYQCDRCQQTTHLFDHDFSRPFQSS